MIIENRQLYFYSLEIFVKMHSLTIFNISLNKNFRQMLSYGTIPEIIVKTGPRNYVSSQPNRWTPMNLLIFITSYSILLGHKLGLSEKTRDQYLYLNKSYYYGPKGLLDPYQRHRIHTWIILVRIWGWSK